MTSPLTKEITLALTKKSISLKTRSLKEFVIKVGSDKRLFDYINWEIRTQKIIGYEIKISKGDFMKMKDKVNSIHDFTQVCDQFFVVVPQPLVDYAKEKLIIWKRKEIGIISYDVNSKKLHTKKMAHIDKTGWLLQFARDNVIEQLEEEWLTREHREKVKRLKVKIEEFLDSSDETDQELS